MLSHTFIQGQAGPVDVGQLKVAGESAMVALRAAGPALGVLCDTLRAQRGGQALQAMRKLRRIWLEYPTDIVEAVVARALEFGLVDLQRIEQMILRNIRGDFFKLPKDEDDDGR